MLSAQNTADIQYMVVESVFFYVLPPSDSDPLLSSPHLSNDENLENLQRSYYSDLQTTWNLWLCDLWSKTTKGGREP